MSMEIKDTGIPWLKIILPKKFEDHRGSFIKTFNKEFFEENWLSSDFKESFFSISHKDVIRGMHFQLPPMDHDKLVYVVRGRILDVIVDLRKWSPTEWKFLSFELSQENNHILYIPKWCAHWFLSLENNSIVIYMQNTIYSPEKDSGIRYDSFGMERPTNNPIVSEKDKKFKWIEEFDSPFII